MQILLAVVRWMACLLHWGLGLARWLVIFTEAIRGWRNLAQASRRPRLAEAHWQRFQAYFGLRGIPLFGGLVQPIMLLPSNSGGAIYRRGKSSGKIGCWGDHRDWFAIYSPPPLSLPARY